MDQQPTTNNTGTRPSTPTTPIIRDVLGGDEGKVVSVEQALGDSLERPTTENASAPRPLATPAIDTSAPTLEEELEPKRQTVDNPQPIQHADVNPIPVPDISTTKEPSPEPVRRSAIRTLQSDIASSVRDNNLSLTKIALARQEKVASVTLAPETPRRFLNVWVIGTLVLVGAGIAAVVGAFVFVQQTNIPLPFIPAKAPAATLVPVDARTTFDVTRTTRAQLIQSIDEFTSGDFSSPVAIEAFIMEELVGTSTDATQISVERFFEILGTRAPGRLVRSIGPDMTFGRVGGAPFLITTTNSYENTFDALLEWEAFMAADLPVITKEPAQTADSPQPTAEEIIATTTPPNETATTTGPDAVEPTPTFVPPPPAPVWKDIIVRNKDVRALIDHEGNVLILYAFPKDGYLAIVQNQEALGVIDGALNSPVFGG